MKKSSFLIILLITIVYSFNVYAKDTVISLNKYSEEKFNFIEKAYDTEGKHTGYITGGHVLKETIELEDNKYCDYGDLLFAWSASFGAFIWSGEKVIYHYHIWKVLYDESYLNKLYYCYLLNTMTNSFMNDLHGIGMMHLTKVGMEQYILPLPPLPLQQEFAKRIELIEQQKAQISSTIKDLETLLASRMQYWFD